MVFSLLTAANWPVIGQICWVLGKVMNFIYMGLDRILPFDTGLVGLSIIVYTILIYMLMLPITYRQQRSSKMTAMLNPELQAIQKKYKNKRDQESMAKQQEEMQQVYDKYGVSMWSGCLPMLIQMPLLFALYPVVYDIASYVPAIAEGANPLVNQFLTIPDMTLSPSTMIRNSGSYGFSAAVIVITCIVLPLLSGLTQYLSIRLSSSNTNGQNTQMSGSMRTMNMIMPLFSIWIVFSMPSGIGLYWIISAIVRVIQQALINRHLDKIDMEALIEANREKAEQKKEKRMKKKDQSENIAAMAQTRTRNLNRSANQNLSTEENKERVEKLEQARAKNEHAKEGSLAARANMVKPVTKEKK